MMTSSMMQRKSSSIEPSASTPLDTYAFDEKKLLEKFKGKTSVPSRVRVRIYLVKAVVIGGGNMNPYLSFSLGKNTVVNMRNMVGREPTTSPEFYRLQERDIDMPTDSRLQVDLWNMVDVAVAGDKMDSLIGSTVIDLEDRWHSARWKEADRKRKIP